MLGSRAFTSKQVRFPKSNWTGITFLTSKPKVILVDPVTGVGYL